MSNDKKYEEGERKEEWRRVEEEGEERKDKKESEEKEKEEGKKERISLGLFISACCLFIPLAVATHYLLVITSDYKLPLILIMFSFSVIVKCFAEDTMPMRSVKENIYYPSLVFALMTVAYIVGLCLL